MDPAFILLLLINEIEEDEEENNSEETEFIEFFILLLQFVLLVDRVFSTTSRRFREVTGFFDEIMLNNALASTRFSSSEFDDLLQIIQSQTQFSRNNRLTLSESLLAFLMKLRSNMFLQDMALICGVSRSTVCRHYHKMLRVCTDAFQHEITYPEAEERDQLQQTIEDLPGAIGYVDATLVQIRRPKKRQSLHYSGRKKKHARIYQAMCDHRGSIRHIFDWFKYRHC